MEPTRRAVVRFKPGRQNWPVSPLRRMAAAFRVRDSDISLPPSHREVAVVAFREADLARQGELTREQAAAAMARALPNLPRRRIARALAGGLFPSRSEAAGDVVHVADSS